MVNYLFFVAEEVREFLSTMGYRTLDEIIGHSELLSAPALEDHWKGRHLDLTPLLQMPDVPHGTPIRCVERQPDILAEQLDWELLQTCKDAAGASEASPEDRVDLEPEPDGRHASELLRDGPSTARPGSARTRST